MNDGQTDAHRDWLKRVIEEAQLRAITGDAAAAARPEITRRAVHIREERRAAAREAAAA